MVENSLTKKIRTLSLLTLFFMLIISLGYNYRLKTENSQLKQISKEASTKLDASIPLNQLIDLLEKRPETIYSQGYKIVSGSYLQDNKIYNIAFFNPFNNSLLILKATTYPLTNCSQRLFLQDGNSYHNESGVLVDWFLKVEYIGDTQIKHNISVWETPTKWESYVFPSETYVVEIDEGWYTLSLDSPVRYSSSGLMWGRNSTCEYEDQIYQLKSWVDFKIEKDGELSPFLVECIFPD